MKLDDSLPVGDLLRSTRADRTFEFVVPHEAAAREIKATKTHHLRTTVTRDRESALFGRIPGSRESTLATLNRSKKCIVSQSFDGRRGLLVILNQPVSFGFDHSIQCFCIQAPSWTMTGRLWDMTRLTDQEDDVNHSLLEAPYICFSDTNQPVRVR